MFRNAPFSSERVRSGTSLLTNLSPLFHDTREETRDIKHNFSSYDFNEIVDTKEKMKGRPTMRFCFIIAN